MKQLYLLRHAKSSWDQPNLDDFERPLNKRGHRDAPVMGKVIAGLELQPDLIISSPAVRAAFTARIVAGQIGISDSRLRYDNRVYDASVNTLLQILRSVDQNISTLLMVGHNPGLTDLIDYLSNKKIENLQTAGLYGMKFNIANWQDIGEESGMFILYDFPKNHKDLFGND